MITSWKQASVLPRLISTSPAFGTSIRELEISIEVTAEGHMLADLRCIVMLLDLCPQLRHLQVLGLPAEILRQGDLTGVCGRLPHLRWLFLLPPEGEEDLTTLDLGSLLTLASKCRELRFLRAFVTPFDWSSPPLTPSPS